MKLQSLFNNWQRKSVSIVAAIVIWFFINHSIISTVTIPHVPIRIINVPAGKTIQGLLPTGILSKRVTLSLSGTKDVIEQLELGDIEVHIDASNNPDEWILQINKKNLVSLNPNIDLTRNTSHVSHNEFVIKMSKLVTEQIPVIILPPKGEAPKGYQFLDAWPQELKHTISGPEEQVDLLKSTGIELSFNLNEISKAELDAIQSSQISAHGNEINYAVSPKWKQIPIHFLNTLEQINDPNAQNLHISFLRDELVPISFDIPIRVFYPAQSLSLLNPDIYTLAPSEFVTKKTGVYFLSIPLYTMDVSKVFLETIRNHIEISITACTDSDTWQHSIAFINPQELEDHYVTAMITAHSPNKGGLNPIAAGREEQLRQRFRDYMQKFALFTKAHQPLKLTGKPSGNFIKVDLNSHSVTNR